MSTRYVFLCVLCIAAGCATPGGQAPATKSVSHLPLDSAALCFCADGSGGPGGTTGVLRGVAEHNKAPVRIEMVEWSHGRGRYLIDHLGWSNIERSGHRLAKQVQELRLRHPDRRITFVGQSAGAAVVLVAAAQLPPTSVDRIILLAPSVSCRYDLRPALTTSREGIDVFYSRNDVFVLGLATVLSGTTDRDIAPAAGRVGFRKVATHPSDEALYSRLRQYEWNPDVSRTGNTGGHFGASNPEHVQEYVLPMLLGSRR